MNLVIYLNEVYPDSNIYVYFMSRGETGGWSRLKNIEKVTLVFNNFNSEKTSFPYLLYYLIKNIKSVDLTYTTHMHVNSLMCTLRRLNLFKTKYIIIRKSTIISQRFNGIKKYIFNFLYQSYGSHDLLICQTSVMKNEFLKVRGSRISGNIQL